MSLDFLSSGDFSAASSLTNLKISALATDRDPAAGGKTDTGRRSRNSLIGRDISLDVISMKRLALSLLLCGLGIIAVGFLGGWWYVGGALEPINVISRIATRIADGNLKERIEAERGNNELQQLISILNRMFDRLEAAFDRQKQFTADASHELRTPITILLSETQRILKRERSSAEYRASAEKCQKTAERMRSLIAQLLVLARRESMVPTAGERIDISIPLSAVVNSLEVLAAENAVDITADLGELFCQIDAQDISLVASNLIGNAIMHNRRGGRVRVRTFVHSDYRGFEVSDNGPGIDTAQLPHIFERFYRGDKSRSSVGGHSGLGLAITKAVVESNGGTITVRSAVEKGSTFTVVLPFP